MAAREMVVDHTDGLHVSVHYCATHELEATPLHVFTEGPRDLAARRDLGQSGDTILNRMAADEAPLVGRKRAAFLGDLQKCACISHRGFDFRAIAHDCRVKEQLGNSVRIEACHAPRIETRKGFPVAFALAQNSQPAETGLGAFQYQELEQFLVIQDWNAPFFVMVADVEGVRTSPVAAMEIGGLTGCHGDGIAWLEHGKVEVVGRPTDSKLQQ